MKIKLIEFLSQESDAPKNQIIFMLISGSIANVLMLGIINSAAEIASKKLPIELDFFFLYFTLAALSITAKKFAYSKATLLVEEVIRRVRLRLVNKIRHCELQFLEQRLEKAEVYARLTQDSNMISHAAPIFISTSESLLSLFLVFLYIASLSFPGFLIIVVFLAFANLIYFLNYQQISSELSTASAKEAELFDSLNNVLTGFKEIKLNYKKNNDVFRDVEVLSTQTEQLKANAELKFTNNLLLTITLYYVMMGAILFILPIFIETHSAVVVKLSATLLFMFGPVVSLLSGIPTIALANVAITNLNELEAKLDASGTTTLVKPPIYPTDFEKITLTDVTFQYEDKSGKPTFVVGPINLTLQQGEIVFLVGGNGSGKSTLLKLITGLYYPLAGGIITLDDDKLDSTNYPEYRELFSTIFTDFYLFKKLYGLGSPDRQQVTKLLHEMELQSKTKYWEGQFTNTDLSTGQRKRLAYISAVLENKAIYVFDEWAADQDPEFRKHFYHHLLPELRSKGKTIFAVTHDDKYFGVADRVLKMEEGQLINYTG
jgi:putative ATP-binding cassette transporter